MFKKFGIASIFTIFSFAAYAGMWELINTQYDGNKVYCTYKLQGTNIQKTIIGAGICQALIYE
jgi:hypothetical protein